MKSGKVLCELEEGEVYSYLRVTQRFGADPTKMKRWVEKEYTTRIHEVWRSVIGGRSRHKIRGEQGS